MMCHARWGTQVHINHSKPVIYGMTLYVFIAPGHGSVNAKHGRPV